MPTPSSPPFSSPACRERTFARASASAACFFISCFTCCNSFCRVLPASCASSAEAVRSMNVCTRRMLLVRTEFTSFSCDMAASVSGVSPPVSSKYFPATRTPLAMELTNALFTSCCTVVFTFPVILGAIAFFFSFS